MSKLKLGSVEHEKPITMRIKLPATVHRDLAAYAELLKREGGTQLIRTRSSHRCWLDSWRQIGHLYGPRKIQNDDG
jgi:hypothetical protein